ncbi:hypothetical protein BJ875DRAFT_489680 [Amylocarpus encephaloides]|uniref:Uncharacterized protein n=1 Tax=Amylocarpus encephaloides TaxID=45428 RepID=A0A9P8BZJ0_9HELO|nr:hypothetical protein BJ875DRAFT_489680 [Amylocarpus encephaloides]
MPESPANNIHKSHSKPSYLSIQDPPQVKAVEIDKSPLRIVPFPALRDRIRQLFLHQDHSSGYHPEPSSTRSGPRLAMITSWIKTEVPKIVYANMLALLLTGLLAGFGLLPIMFTSIRDSRALDGVGRAGKAVLSAAQDAPILAVVGTALTCGVVALSWHCWGNWAKYVWLTDRAFLPTLLDSVLTIGMALLNVCAARGRQWIVTAFMTAAAATTTTLVAIIMYIVYEGMSGSAWEEEPVLKETRVA